MKYKDLQPNYTFKLIEGLGKIMYIMLLYAINETGLYDLKVRKKQGPSLNAHKWKRRKFCGGKI